MANKKPSKLSKPLSTKEQLQKELVQPKITSNGRTVRADKESIRKNRQTILKHIGRAYRNISK